VNEESSQGVSKDGMPKKQIYLLDIFFLKEETNMLYGVR